MKINLLLSLATWCLLLSCKKDQVKGEPFISGNYEGTFNYTNGNKTAVSPAKISFGPTTYSSAAQPGRKPAGGAGKYTFNSNSFKFTDTHIWTADFDWSLILNGDYAYKVMGDSLILTKSFAHIDNAPSNALASTYQYRLKRVKDMPAE
ncbi:hypothetical protein [Pedobacter nototheniae]|uniref:hypothetical protein n=1 Tax=Pedobacter nototheniae TaxID=2488994 RepID=UPI00292CE0AA|nr:hypothetical protein [Pedobacter nototheniae]